MAMCALILACGQGGTPTVIPTAAPNLSREEAVAYVRSYFAEQPERASFTVFRLNQRGLLDPGAVGDWSAMWAPTLKAWLVTARESEQSTNQAESPVQFHFRLFETTLTIEELPPPGDA